MLRYSLLNRAIATQTENSALTQALNELHKLIRHDFVALTKDISPRGFTELYFELEQEFKRFREFCAYPAVSEKVLVAFGGGFSAGKSTLINTLLGERILLASTNPTTAIPTYILQGEQKYFSALNMHQQKIVLSEEEFATLTHDQEDEYQSHLAYLLETVFVTRDDFPWKNIAFVDTPGYSKPDDANWTGRTDEQVARTQLNIAQVIVWAMSVESGNISEDDLTFLGSLRPDVPKLIAITKADKVSEEEVLRVVSLVKQTLESRNIRYEDVVPVSNRGRSGFKVDSLLGKIAEWDQRKHELRFAHNFKAKFTQFAQFLDELERELQYELHRLNRIAAMQEGDNTASDIKELLTLNEFNINKIDSLNENLSVLRQQFFKQLRQIADNFGVLLFEPSEIDLIDKIQINVASLINSIRNDMGKVEQVDYSDLLLPFRQTEDIESFDEIIKENTPEEHIIVHCNEYEKNAYLSLLLSIFLTGKKSLEKNQITAFENLLQRVNTQQTLANLYAYISNITQQKLEEHIATIYQLNLEKTFLIETLVISRMISPLNDEQITLIANISDIWGFNGENLQGIIKTTTQTQLEWWNALSDRWKNRFYWSIGEKNKTASIQPTTYELRQVLKLREIEVRNSAVLDQLSFQPLHRLTDLQTLKIDLFAQSEMHEFANLTQLIKLDLTGMFLDDISLLSPLRKLESLNLMGNIKDISTLSGLTKLHTLNLRGCWEVTDISALSHLTKLEKLDLSMCSKISDISPLSSLIKLRVLSLSPHRIFSEISSVLVNFTELKILDLSNCGYIDSVSDISGLSRLIKLEELNLSSCNKIIDISALSRLTELNTLSLSRCEKIIDISVLSNLIKLKTLSLYGCNLITDFSGLLNLTNLKKLNLRECTNLTRTQIKELQLALPNCNIINDFD